MRPLLVRSLLLLPLAAAVPASAQPPGQPAGQAAGQDAEPDTRPEGIVVTGIRIGDYRDRLRACLARKCPTNEDADATLALAEALLLEGEYGEARREVASSLKRNKKQTKAYPEPVADLYRAHARLSRHLGHDQIAERSTRDILATLKEGLPVEDHRHFTARLELAELLMTMADLRGAKRELGKLADIARRSGREDVAVLAGLRGLWFDYIAVPHGEAKSRLIGLSQLAEPARRMESTGAKILLARIYRAEKDEARADALLAEIGRGNTARRRLLHAPTYQLLNQEVTFGSQEELATAVRYGSTLKRLPPNFEKKWIDVGFWVGPDGLVSGLEIVRRGSDSTWAAPLLDSIRGRRYSTAREATYRLERYTMTSDYEQVSGSRIRQHSPRARVEYFDISEPGAGTRQP